jgi:hypothetical protein
VGRARVLLAAGRTSLRGGQRRAVSLPLRARGRRLLRARHKLRARLTLRARDASGNRRTTLRQVTLRASR